MELDNLKEIWKSQAATPAGEQEEFRAMISTRSNSPVSRMKRNLVLELVIVVLLYGGVVVFYFLALQGVWRIVGWIYLGLGALYLAYFYRKFKLLSEMQCLTCHVKNNLQRLVKNLERYVRFYLISGTVAIFALLWFFWIMLALNLPQLGERSIFFPSATRSIWLAGTYWLLPSLFITLITHLLNKWNLNKFYGRHIRKLQELLNQMETLDN
jgi:Ca2+/Na+ antiporter